MPELKPETEQHQIIQIRNQDGMVTEEASMLGGVLDGETIVYSYSRVVARLLFKNGKQEGEAVFYDEIGQVTMRGNYAAGKREGETTYYDRAGNVARKENYEKDQLHGRKTDFYPSGKAREVSHYQEGLLHGEMLRFSLDGKLQERICYAAGKKVRCPPQVLAKR